MSKNKKVNPRRRPASMQDVTRARRAAQEEAVVLAWALLFSALRDKEGFGPKRLRRVWDEVNYISDSIRKGYVKPRDLISALAEDGIVLCEAEKEKNR